MNPRATNAFTIPAPIPCDAPVTMGVFAGLLIGVYLEHLFTEGAGPILSTGAALRRRFTSIGPM